MPHLLASLPPRSGSYNADYEPADLMLGSGSSGESRLIKAFTVAPWHWFRGDWRDISHVAICCDLRGEPALAHFRRVQGEPKVLVESTTENRQPSLFARAKGGAVAGVQAHWPEKWMADYPGKVYRARLTPRQALDRIERQRLTEFLLDFDGQQYDFLGAIEAGLGISHAQHLTEAFCAAVVGEALMRLSRLELAVADRWTPSALVEHLVRLGIYQTPVRLK